MWLRAADAEGFKSVNQRYNEFYEEAVARSKERLVDKANGLFCVIDTNGNGVLGRKEIATFVEEYGDKHSDFLYGGDVDKDGEVTMDEWRVMWENSWSDVQATRERLRDFISIKAHQIAAAVMSRSEALFAWVDTNGNGSLDKAEIVQYLAENGDKHKEFIMDADVNDDGKVTIKEWMGMWDYSVSEDLGTALRQLESFEHAAKMNLRTRAAALFTKLDIDGSGALEKEEIKAQLTKLGAQNVEFIESANANNDSKVTTLEWSSFWWKFMRESFEETKKALLGFEAAVHGAGSADTAAAAVDGGEAATAAAAKEE